MPHNPIYHVTDALDEEHLSLAYAAESDAFRGSLLEAVRRTVSDLRLQALDDVRARLDGLTPSNTDAPLLPVIKASSVMIPVESDASAAKEMSFVLIVYHLTTMINPPGSE
jgi:hypothetical protein